MIRTVCGPVEPAALGRVSMHEHVLGRPPSASLARDPDLGIDDHALARERVDDFARAGGGTIVDLTTPDYGRDLVGLREVSRATGVHIVAATGLHKEAYSAEHVRAADDARLAERFRADLAGEGEAPVGIIKVGASLDGPTALERRVFYAAGAAHAETGATVTVHLEHGRAGLAALAALDAAGIEPRSVVLAHCDLGEPDEVLAYAASGAWISIDNVGKDHRGSDADRAALVWRLAAAGHLPQIVVGCDHARRSSARSAGGVGLSHLLTSFLRRFDEDVAAALAIENPRRALAWRATR